MQAQVNWAHAIAMQVGVVPISYGSPGTAKTAWHRALARAAGRRFIQCILRQKMPEDLGGVPVPDDIQLTCPLCNGSGLGKDMTSMGWCPECEGRPRKVRGVVHLLGEEMIRAQHERVVLLFDEFNHAGHDVMGAAQEWINNPPPNCWMAACANPVEQSTSGVELAPPVVNRICKLDWEVPVDVIVSGWENGFTQYDEPQLPIVPESYLADHGEYWGKTLSDFRKRFPDVFDKGYPKDANAACEPWPSYRSFTNVGKLFAACDAVGANKAIRAKLAIGCVGTAAATQWLEYVAGLDLPDPEDLLRRPDTLKLPARFDITRTILASVIGAVRGNKTPERWESAFDVIEVAFGQNAEAAMAAEGSLWKEKPQNHMPKQRNGAAKQMRDARLQTV